MKKWKDLKRWKKGGIMGFCILGGINLVILTLDLIIEYSMGTKYPTLALPLLEFPLYVFHFIVLEPLLGKKLIPHSDFFLWVWVYIGGTIAWGIVGSIPGIILGLLSNLSKAKEGKK